MIKLFDDLEPYKEDDFAKYYNKLPFKDEELYFHILFKKNCDIIDYYNKIDESGYYRKIINSPLIKIYESTNGFELYSGSFSIGGFVINPKSTKFIAFDIIKSNVITHKLYKYPEEWLVFGLLSYSGDYGELIYDNLLNKIIMTDGRQKYKILKKWNNLDDLLSDVNNYYKHKYDSKGISKTYKKQFSPEIGNLVDYKI